MDDRKDRAIESAYDAIVAGNAGPAMIWRTLENLYDRAFNDGKESGESKDA